MKHVLIVLLLATAVSAALWAAPPRPFSVQDLVTLERISESRLSPDGRWLVYTVRETDLEANRGRTDLFVIGVDGKGARRLCPHPASDSSPVWSKDGNTVWFQSTRSGSSQVWKVALAGGEPEQVTRLPLDVNCFVLSPDNTRLAVAMEVFPGASPEETVARLEKTAKAKTSGRLYERLFVRHWDTWGDGRRSHVFVLPVGGGAAVDIMKDMDADSPSKPFGGANEYTFTPDGRSIVFTARVAGAQEAWSTNFDLYLAPCDGSQAPRNLTPGNPAWDTTPVFSPDGKYMAYLAMSRPGFEADRYRLMVRAWPDGAEREVAPAWDRSPDGPTWSADGKEIFVTADHLGQRPLFAVEVKSGKVRALTIQGTVKGFSIGTKSVCYEMDSLLSPVEIWTCGRDGKAARTITAQNAGSMAAVQLGEPEQFTFAGWNNETVYGYAVKPVGFDPARKYPVVLLIHGGPQGSMANDFHYRWNPQPYAGAGYAAVMIDFHGSTGYGQAFTDSISGDWGGKPLEDLQKGLAAALQKYPWMDGERVAALGASYGGYMINWIAGNWPDRFRCLVCHDGNLDERLAYFDTEELWFPEWDHRGTPWENPDGYEKHNPLNFVKNWKTPMLVIHGGLDFRVVETQGMSTFTALQRKGIPSKFLYFPDENHWVLKPHNSILWHETVLAWLAQWLKP